MKLLRMLAAAALALGVTLASAAETDPPAVVGRLNHISGPVSFAPAEANEDWSVADLNRPITTGDRLWTDSSARAELHVGSLAIRMGSQTSVDVLALDEQTLQLRLAQGELNLRVRRLAGDKLLEIATPSGAVVVRQPGTYRIGVDPSGSATTVAVRRGGAAEVFTGTSSFAVADNQETEISSSGQALFAARAPDDFDHWAADRDQREDRVISTRYVPEEMTGYEDLDQYGAWRRTPDYGSVWVPTSVPAGWAPYRNGHWVWISPWGWTWVDDAPWGFAPFHYGRWVWLGNHWAWAPGHRVARPVYAPALVAFIGGSNFSISVGLGSAPAIGWVPLGWREPYRPWYRASHAHVRNVNITDVTNVTNITNHVTNVRLLNRNVPSAVTVVSRENFIAARRADRAALRVDARVLAAAPVTQGAPVATPARTSLAAAERGATPPIAARTRETVAINTPPAPARAASREAREDARNARGAGNEERPRVRVVNRGERVNLQQAADSQRPGAPAPQAQTAAQTSRVPSEASKGGAADAARTERSPAMARPQATPQPAQARSGPPASDNPALQGQAQWSQQAERRAPAPPPEVSRRPTFDRDIRPSTAEARREQRQAERQERRADRREQPLAQRDDLPRAQAVPPDTPAASTSRPAPDALRAQQIEQQQAQRRQQAEQQQVREQQARQREAQQQREQQQAQQRQQQAAQQQVREQQARQREAQQQNEERQRAQQQREQQQAQQRQQQTAQQQQVSEQQARQRELQQQAEQQRAQQLRAEQQARGQQAREQQTRQREAQRQNEERQRAQQQAQQPEQQAQAQQAAREQQARQEAVQRAQRPQQQRAEQERENRRERQRPDRDRG